MAYYEDFVNLIINQGMYVEDFDYMAMYNIMVHTIIENIIPTTTFIYTYRQVNMLYNYLTPLVLMELNQHDIQINEIENIIQINEIENIIQNQPPILNYIEQVNFDINEIDINNIYG